MLSRQRRKLLLLCLVGVLVVALITVWYKRSGWRSLQEGFQTAPAATTRTFEELLRDQYDTAVAAKIDEVMYGPEDPPAPAAPAAGTTAPASPTVTVANTFRMMFPRDLSIYALSNAGENAATARINLITQYDALNNEFKTVFQNPANNEKWDADPKTETCNQLAELRTILQSKVAALRAKIQDLSGSQVVGGRMKDENLALQKALKATCEKDLTPECITLATQDDKLFPLLAEYNAVNDELFTQEADVIEELKVVSDTYKFLSCGGAALGFDAEKEVGYIDTEALRIKLEKISPYYLSPAALTYVANYLPEPAVVEDTGVTAGRYIASAQGSVDQIVKVAAA